VVRRAVFAAAAVGYNIKTASAIAIGGIVVDNDVSGGAIAYINNSTVTAGALSVTANDNAAITANVNATASVAGGSVFGDTGGQTSTVLAVNAAIATNQVIGAATAYITGSTITTTADTTNIVPLTAGDVVQLGTARSMNMSDRPATSIFSIRRTATVRSGKRLMRPRTRHRSFG